MKLETKQAIETASLAAEKATAAADKANLEYAQVLIDAAVESEGYNRCNYYNLALRVYPGIKAAINNPTFWNHYFYTLEADLTA